MPAVARLSTVVLETRDMPSLAAFYSALTGLPIAERGEDWWELEAPPGGPRVAIQLAPDHVPTTWPTGERPLQLHLDFDVDDLDAAERQVLELGARKAEHQPGTSFRVFLDPAGHPFCLCVS
jgi:predicted enzyme related to lactoylglutathione lyase